jgi:hypothetical protein
VKRTIEQNQESSQTEEDLNLDDAKLREVIEKEIQNQKLSRKKVKGSKDEWTTSVPSKFKGSGEVREDVEPEGKRTASRSK